MVLHTDPIGKQSGLGRNLLMCISEDTGPRAPPKAVQSSQNYSENVHRGHPCQGEEPKGCTVGAGQEEEREGGNFWAVLE